jgi:hypothetical protein
MLWVMTSGLTPLNRLLNLVPKRAEMRQSDELRETFVDSGVAVALEAVDHQVLFGRRGTGKTHALRYLESIVRGSGNVSVYVDLRTVGSPEGLFQADALHATERAARLLVDMLTHVHEALLEAALNDDRLIVDTQFVNNLDFLLGAISSIRVTGEVEVRMEDERATAEKGSGSFGLTAGKAPTLDVKLSGEQSNSAKEVSAETRRELNEPVSTSEISRRLSATSRSLSPQSVSGYC